MAIAGAVRFCQNNFLRAPWATVTSSSSEAGYSFTQSLTENRYEYWRPSGNFEITSANRVISINDGADKTVNLTIAAYATGVALASHIQTSLNAASTNWTCTYSNTTRKFTIGRVSGTSILRFTVTANATWDTLGYTQVTDTPAGTGLAAVEARNHTSEWFKVDFGAPVEVGFIGMIGRPDGGIGLSAGATVKVMANIVDDFSSPPINVTVTPEDTGVFKFLDGLTPTYRWWKVEIFDRETPVSTGADGYQFTQVYLGDYVTPETVNFRVGFSAIQEDPALVQTSQTGVGFYKIYPKFWRFESLTAEYISDEDRAAVLKVFRDLGVSVPLFVSLDPLVQVSQSLGEFTKFMRFETAPRLNHILRNLYSFDASFREVI